MASSGEILSGQLLDEELDLSLAELCRTCRLPAERVFELVEHGVLEPCGPGMDEGSGSWRFRAVSIRRVTCAVRLQRDLGVNPAGAALALDLLDEIERLRARVRRLGLEADRV